VVQIVRMMNVGLHGIDKTRDFLGRNLRGNPVPWRARRPADLLAGADSDWFYPAGAFAMSAAAVNDVNTMSISVREARMTLDRIFLAAGVPDGLVPSVRE